MSTRTSDSRVVSEGLCSEDGNNKEEEGGGGELYLERYVIKKVLGEGSYGKVKLGVDIYTNEKVALKIIPKSVIKKASHITRLKREVRIMRLLHHPNIVKLHEVTETEKEVVLAMDYVEGGELFDYIVAHKRLNEYTARKLFRQIISAVEYCHQSSIIHRDLKPENLLMDNNKVIKIIDFGFANLFDPSDTLHTFCGSPYYASPEMALGKKYIGPEVDIWSLGVILFALLTGKLPFRDPNTSELYKKIIIGQYETPSYLSPDASDLIKTMLQVDSNTRATVKQIMEHPWVLEGYTSAPDTFLPVRTIIQCEEEFDEEILQKMVLFGMDLIETKQQILGKNCGPAFSLYCLLREQKEREFRPSADSKDGRLSANFASTKSGQENQGSVSLRKSISVRDSSSRARAKRAMTLQTLAATKYNKELSHLHQNRIGSQHIEYRYSTMPRLKNKVAADSKDSISSEANFNVGSSRDQSASPDTCSDFPAQSDPRMPSKEEDSTTKWMRNMHVLSKKLSSSSLEKYSQKDVSSKRSLIYSDSSCSTGNTPTNSNTLRRYSEINSRQRGKSSLPAFSPISPPSNTNAVHPVPPIRRNSFSTAISQALQRLKTNIRSKMQTPTTVPNREKTIVESHKEPRTSNAVFGIDTTSNKPTAEIVTNLKKVLDNLKIQYSWSGHKADCVSGETTFEIEVVQIHRTTMKGIKMHRTKGSTWAYQGIARAIIIKLEL